MNVLILSCGSRNLLVKYFKEKINHQGKVIAADCSPLAPALYEAHDYVIVPRVDDEHYLDTVLDICKTKNIQVLISLIDPELTLISKHAEMFHNHNVLPIVSSYEAIMRAYNKHAFTQYLDQHGFDILKTWDDLNLCLKDIDNQVTQFPLIVKPLYGSASAYQDIAMHKDQLNAYFNLNTPKVIQEHIDAAEYGVDCYVDMHTKKLVSMFIKQKLRMRAGETDKSVSVHHPKIQATIERFIDMSDYFGILDFDVLVKNDIVYILELNPRFGGGYPHAHACGVDMIQMILNNAKGIENTPEPINYQENIAMMKYSVVQIKHLDSRKKDNDA